MAATFCGIEQKYGRQYLGDGAIDVYNLDRAKLQEVADRIGPTVGQLSEACVPPEGATAGLYAFRTGPGAVICWSTPSWRTSCADRSPLTRSSTCTSTAGCSSSGRSEERSVGKGGVGTSEQLWWRGREQK